MRDAATGLIVGQPIEAASDRFGDSNRDFLVEFAGSIPDPAPTTAFVATAFLSEEAWPTVWAVNLGSRPIELRVVCFADARPAPCWHEPVGPRISLQPDQAAPLRLTDGLRMARRLDVVFLERHDDDSPHPRFLHVHEGAAVADVLGDAPLRDEPHAEVLGAVT